MNTIEPRIYTTGITSIDAQHYQIVEMLGQIAGRRDSNLEGSELKTVFRDLQEYARTHFKHEEECMQKANFPQFLEHCREHAYFLRYLELLRLRLQEHSVFPASDMANFLRTWLLEHIGIKDKEYLPYFRQAGIE